MKRYVVLICFLAPLLMFGRGNLGLQSERDAARLDSVLSLLQVSEGNFGQRLVMAAENFIGAGEDDYYSTDSVGLLRINVDTFTPLMFINNVIALAKASELPGMVDELSFERELIDIACRRGEDRGYPSIMFHTSDWIGDNMSRGNVSELTENYAGAVARTKSLDEMTRNRAKYAALADSSVFESVRMTEMGFRTHRVPSLKKETIKKKEILEDLRDGDIIVLVPNGDGTDMFDIGFVSMEGNNPYFIHLSPQSHKVVREKEPLPRYMALVTKYFQGYRILRVK